jgi:phage terminase large subunit
MVEYHEDNGLDADEWIDILGNKPWAYGTIYLPHDARAKTFATRHSVVEQFLKAKGDGRLNAERIVVVPQVKTQDRVNAARTVLPHCRFDHAACAPGLLALREWSYKWDDERRTYGKEPDHNWASHGADGFTYGALMLRERVRPVKAAPTPLIQASANFTLDQLFVERERFNNRNRLP